MPLHGNLHYAYRYLQREVIIAELVFDVLKVLVKPEFNEAL
jgi:hypothetical protein